MLGIAGDLGTMPVQDVVLYLGNRELSGTLSLENASVKKAVAIRNGLAINAASNEPREFLGQFLLNFGYVNEDHLSKAFQRQSEHRALLGRILVGDGVVDEASLSQVMAIKIRETVLEVFRWHAGSFRFARDVLPALAEGVAVEVSLLDVHRESEFRESAWTAMLQIFPKGNLSLRLIESTVPRDVAPGSMDARMFQAVREGQTINEMLLTLHATDFQLYQRLYALYRQGVLVPDAAQPERTDHFALGIPPAEALARARQAFAAGRLLDAEVLAIRAAEGAASREAADFLGEIQAVLQTRLREAFFAARRVPSLLIEPAKVRTIELTPAEKYLLAHIDGVRDVRNIVSVSPVREVDALKCFQRFVDTGLVTMT